MADQTTDNQTQDNGSPVTNGEGTNIADIMGNMAGKTEPDAKPAEGNKADGTDAKPKDEPSTPAWMQQLPEEMRNDAALSKQLAKFQKIGDMAKSYSELETKLGKSLIKPAEDASDEEKQKFFEKLGKPTTAEGYSIKDENAAAFKEIAYKNNLTDAQAVSLYEQFKSIGEGAIKAQQENLQKQANATTEALKKEYGNHYGEKIEMLRRGVETYGGQELGNLLKESGLLANETIVRMFIKLGEQSSEAGTAAKTTGKAEGYVPTEEGGRFDFIEKHFTKGE